MGLTARERLTKGMFTLQTQQPFFAYIGMHVKFIETDKVPTIAVDTLGNCYFNPEFITTLNDQEIVGVMIHEIGHIAFEHLKRRVARDPEAWNVSTDGVINNIAKNAGFTLPEGGITPNDKGELEIFGTKFKDINSKTAEELYDEIARKFPLKEGRCKNCGGKVMQGITPFVPEHIRKAREEKAKAKEAKV